MGGESIDSPPFFCQFGSKCRIWGGSLISRFSQASRKIRNTWLAGEIRCGKCGYTFKRPATSLGMNISVVPSEPTTKVVRDAAHSVKMSLNSLFSLLREKSSGSSSYFGGDGKSILRLPPIRWSLHR